jgi:hypothetical protein
MPWLYERVPRGRSEVRARDQRYAALVGWLLTVQSHHLGHFHQWLSHVRPPQCRASDRAAYGAVGLGASTHAENAP